MVTTIVLAEDMLVASGLGIALILGVTTDS